MPTKDGWPCIPTPDKVNPNPTWDKISTEKIKLTPKEEEKERFTHAIYEALIEDGHAATIWGLGERVRIMVYRFDINLLINADIDTATTIITEDNINPFMTEKEKRANQYTIPLSDPTMFQKINHIIKTHKNQ
jgi:hypothetical protein